MAKIVRISLASHGPLRIRSPWTHIQHRSRTPSTITIDSSQPGNALGCSANGPSTAIISELDGHVIAAFPGLIGNDEVAFNSTDNHYFLAESNAPTAQLAT